MLAALLLIKTAFAHVPGVSRSAPGVDIAFIAGAVIFSVFALAAFSNSFWEDAFNPVGYLFGSCDTVVMSWWRGVALSIGAFAFYTGTAVQLMPQTSRPGLFGIFLNTPTLTSLSSLTAALALLSLRAFLIRLPGRAIRNEAFRMDPASTVLLFAIPALVLLYLLATSVL